MLDWRTYLPSDPTTNNTINFFTVDCATTDKSAICEMYDGKDLAIELR